MASKPGDSTGTAGGVAAATSSALEARPPFLFIEYKTRWKTAFWIVLHPLVIVASVLLLRVPANSMQAIPSDAVAGVCHLPTQNAQPNCSQVQFCRKFTCPPADCNTCPGIYKVTREVCTNNLNCKGYMVVHATAEDTVYFEEESGSMERQLCSSYQGPAFTGTFRMNQCNGWLDDFSGRAVSCFALGNSSEDATCQVDFPLTVGGSALYYVLIIIASVSGAKTLILLVSIWAKQKHRDEWRMDRGWMVKTGKWFEPPL
jgi:hypothetical protein